MASSYEGGTEKEGIVIKANLTLGENAITDEYSSHKFERFKLNELFILTQA